MKQFFLAVSLLTLIGTQASAAFPTNRQNWDELPQMYKFGFAVGVYMEMSQGYVFDSPEADKVSDIYFECVRDLQINAGSMVKIIDTFYSELENFSEPANLALVHGLAKVCKDYK
jgi:hypothetical protein